MGRGTESGIGGASRIACQAECWRCFVALGRRCAPASRSSPPSVASAQEEVEPPVVAARPLPPRRRSHDRVEPQARRRRAAQGAKEATRQRRARAVEPEVAGRRESSSTPARVLVVGDFLGSGLAEGLTEVFAREPAHQGRRPRPAARRASCATTSTTGREKIAELIDEREAGGRSWSCSAPTTASRCASAARARPLRSENWIAEYARARRRVRQGDLRPQGAVPLGRRAGVQIAEDAVGHAGLQRHLPRRGGRRRGRVRRHLGRFRRRERRLCRRPAPTSTASRSGCAPMTASTSPGRASARWPSTPKSRSTRCSARPPPRALRASRPPICREPCCRRSMSARSTGPCRYRCRIPSSMAASELLGLVAAPKRDARSPGEKLAVEGDRARRRARPRRRFLLASRRVADHRPAVDLGDRPLRRG